MSLAPTTNVNSGSSNPKVYAPNSPWADADGYVEVGDRKKQSGVGAALGFNVGFNKRMGNDFSFVAAVNGEGRVYGDSTFNSYAFSESAEMRYLLERGYFGLGLVGSQSLKSDALSFAYTSYGVRTALRYAISAKNNLGLTAVHEWRDYADSTKLDGTALLLDADWTHAFDSSFTATISAGYDRINANEEASAYDTWSGGLSLYKELPQGLTMGLGGQLRWSNFDGENATTLQVRQDTRLIGNINLTKRDFNIFGFAPSLSYTYTNNF